MIELENLVEAHVCDPNVFLGVDGEAVRRGEHAVAPCGENFSGWSIDAINGMRAAVKHKDVIVRIDSDPRNLPESDSFRQPRPAVHHLIRAGVFGVNWSLHTDPGGHGQNQGTQAAPQRNVGSCK